MRRLVIDRLSGYIHTSCIPTNTRFLQRDILIDTDSAYTYLDRQIKTVVHKSADESMEIALRKVHEE